MKNYRLGFFVTVDMPGVDERDAQNRAEHALGLWGRTLVRRQNPRLRQGHICAIAHGPRAGIKRLADCEQPLAKLLQGRKQ